MKVLKCNETPVKTKPKSLSFEDIQKEEGVYQSYDDDSATNLRLIVIRHPLVSVSPVVLFYDRHSNSLSPTYTPSWDRLHFVKTDERVCFEIK